MFCRKAIYLIISRLLSLALLAAGLLKGRDVLLGTQEGQGFWEDWRVAASIAGFEIVFSLWLLVGLFPQITRWLAVICFGFFLCFAVASVLAGESSCGCFGSLAVSPWYTATFDLLAVAALVAGGPGRLSAPTRRSVRFRFATFVSLLLAGSVAGMWTAVHFTPIPLGEEGEIREGASVLSIDPVNWTGRRLPLLPHIDIGAQLGRGRWIILLYRRDCPACWEAVARYVGFAHELASQSSGARVALVEVPVDGGALPYDAGARVQLQLRSAVVEERPERTIQ